MTRTRMVVIGVILVVVAFLVWQFSSNLQQAR